MSAQQGAPLSSSDQYIVYGDFNCPFCYALHERLHDLSLIERIEWRGAHAPYLPFPMSIWQATMKAELHHEVSVVKRLAPGLSVQLPSGRPNTRIAIECAADVLSRIGKSACNL